MSACSKPLSSDVLVAYWASDLPQAEVDAVDEHLMGCDECTRRSERIAQISEALRALLPPLLSQAQLGALEGRGLAVAYNPMAPGERRAVVFPRDADLLVHRLQGLSFAQARRVDFTIRDEHSDKILVSVPDAPFDPAAGEVLVACQRHYASLPPNTAMDVEIEHHDGSHDRSVYTVLHRF